MSANTFICAISLVLVAVGYVNGQATNCFVCNSTTDANCLFRVNTLTTINCNTVALASCFTRIENQATIRGCLTPALEAGCAADPTCISCVNTAAGVVCNTGLAPANRATCITCNSLINGDCGAAIPAAEAQPCPLHDAAEQRCFTRRSERLVTRGCLSFTSICDDPSQCLFCQGAGCNNLAHTNPAIPLASSAALFSVIPLLAMGSAAFALIKQSAF